jgi:anti-sigma factor RsiW
MEQQAQERSTEPPDDDMTCQQVVALLMDYMTGELEVQTALALQEHLRDCPECAAFLYTYQATIRAVRTLRNEDVPPALQHRVLSFLRYKL